MSSIITRESVAAFVVAFILATAVSVFAWDGPTQSPPNANTLPPINVSSVSQVKTGGLWASSVGSDDGFCIGVDCITSWNEVSGAWTESAGNITFTGGSVGVGTSSPSYPLSVLGTIYTTSGIRFPDGTTQTSANVTSGSPTVQVFTASGTWTKPAGVTRIKVTATAGGGGGRWGSGSGGSGGSSVFGSYLSTTGGLGGTGGNPASGGAGGTATGGDINMSGARGGVGMLGGLGGLGAGSYWGGGGGNGTGTSGNSAAAYGAGGGGGYGDGSNGRGGGGSGGTAIEWIDVSAVSSVSVTVGIAGVNGGAGGIVVVEEYR